MSSKDNRSFPKLRVRCIHLPGGDIKCICYCWLKSKSSHGSKLVCIFLLSPSFLTYHTKLGKYLISIWRIHSNSMQYKCWTSHCFCAPLVDHGLSTQLHQKPHVAGTQRAHSRGWERELCDLPICPIPAQCVAPAGGGAQSPLSIPLCHLPNQATSAPHARVPSSPHSTSPPQVPLSPPHPHEALRRPKPDP